MLKYFRPSKLEKYNCAGTIQDFVVAMLGNLSKPIMSSQNAASWGYFNCTLSDWNNDILSEAEFPVRLLPKVVENGQIVAHLAECWYGIPIGTPIGKKSYLNILKFFIKSCFIFRSSSR